MTQTRLGSFIEAVINVMIGFWINFAANMLVLPLFGWHVSVAQNFALGAIYTGISIARSYAVRRWFNARIATAAARLAETAR